MNAVLLSAGIGERMKPITERIPKPLLSIVDFRMIDYNIARLFDIGVKQIGINLFHKASTIEEYLKKSSKNLHIITEPVLKGTGGALVNFKEVMLDDFIYSSCDVLTDIDLAEVVEFHQTRKPAATLVLRNNKGANFIGIDDEYRIKEIIDKGDDTFYDFAGIAVFSERVFSYLPEKETFSIVEVWTRMLENGEYLLGLPKEMSWYNINSPETYWQIHYDLLINKIALGGHAFDSSFYIDPTSQVRTTALDGFVSIGPNCTISDRVSLTNTVVFGNNAIQDGEYSNCLLSDVFCIEINHGMERDINGI